MFNDARVPVSCLVLAALLIALVTCGAPQPAATSIPPTDTSVSPTCPPTTELTDEEWAAIEKEKQAMLSDSQRLAMEEELRACLAGCDSAADDADADHTFSYYGDVHNLGFIYNGT